MSQTAPSFLFLTTRYCSLGFKASSIMSASRFSSNKSATKVFSPVSALMFQMSSSKNTLPLYQSSGYSPLGTKRGTAQYILDRVFLLHTHFSGSVATPVNLVFPVPMLRLERSIPVPMLSEYASRVPSGFMRVVRPRMPPRNFTNEPPP